MTAKTPIQLGPLPEPDYDNQKTLRDTVFIKECLQDSAYFLDVPEDRTYDWRKGKIIDKNDNYTLCLFLFRFNVGFDYYLCTFNSNGQLINEKEVGARASDWYEIYGFIKDNHSFEIYKNEFGYKNDKPSIKNKLHEKYIIANDGRFVVSK
jgi:hypothetical protein